jgi:hypothetical protein
VRRTVCTTWIAEDGETVLLTKTGPGLYRIPLYTVETPVMEELCLALQDALGPQAPKSIRVEALDKIE